MYLLVIGGNSDIGFEIAKEFYKNGFNLYLTKRPNTNLEKELKNLKDSSERIIIKDFDLSDFNSHQDFYTSLNPKPDVILCAAGLLRNNEELIDDFEETKKIISTNYTAYVSLLNIIGKDFQKRNLGTIIGISSVAGDRGRASNYIYGSTKSAFSTFLSGMRNSMSIKKTKVNVITIKPGFIKTKMTKNHHPPLFFSSNSTQVAKDVYKAWKNKKNIVYTPWYWKYIFILIKLIPERIFKKLNL